MVAGINLPLRQGNQVKFSQWQTNFIPAGTRCSAINFAAARDVYNSPRLIVPEVLRISAFRASLDPAMAIVGLSAFIHANIPSNLFYSRWSIFQYNKEKILYDPCLYV